MRRKRRRGGDSAGGDSPERASKRSSLGGTVAGGARAIKRAASDYRFAHSPAGRAREAAQRGDTIFQHRAMVDHRGHGEVLSAIEAEGWKLDSTEYLTETETDIEPEGHEHVSTMTYAIYFFRPDRRRSRTGRS